MAKTVIYFEKSFRNNNCASFQTFLIPLANLHSTYFPISNLSFLFTLVYTLQWSHNSTLLT